MNADEIQTTPIKIVRQGAPLVNSAHVLIGHRDIKAIEVDLKSKRCTIEGDSNSFSQGKWGAPGILIGTDEYSLHLGKKEGDTEIEFSGFVGWNIFAMGISKYTLRVCLIKLK